MSNKITLQRKDAVRIQALVATVKAKYDISGQMRMADFRRVCKGENVQFVDELDLKRGGYYVSDRSAARYIFIDKKLKGRERLFTVAHECGHHFLKHKLTWGTTKSGKTVTLITKKQQSLQEAEADYFALLFCGYGREVKNA